MIKCFKTMWVARFGYGTVCVDPNFEDGIGEIYLMTLPKPAKIGTEYLEDLTKVSTHGPKIKLRFDKVESIDVLITKLQDIKDLMLEGQANGQKDEKDSGNESRSETGTEETVL